MSKWKQPMDPDRFQMKDLKRTAAKHERHIERLKGELRLLKAAVKSLTDWKANIHANWPPPPPPTQ